MANGLPLLPEIRPEQRTPLVDALLTVIGAQQDRIAKLEESVQRLRDEIAILKGQKPRPKVARLPDLIRQRVAEVDPTNAQAVPT